MIHLAVVCALGAALAALPAAADHGAGLRTEGMSPLVSAILVGGLAFLVGLVVVVMVMTRPSPERRSGPDEQ